MTINNIHYHIDLVFYHRILRCFVLIDLKCGAVKHKDIGQMNMYLGYFAKEENVEGDSPPVGILLCTRKGKKMVEYAIAGMDNNLFVPTCYSCLIRLRSRSSYWTKLETVLSRFWEMNINI